MKGLRERDEGRGGEEQREAVHGLAVARLETTT